MACTILIFRTRTSHILGLDLLTPATRFPHHCAGKFLQLMGFSQPQELTTSVCSRSIAIQFFVNNGHLVLLSTYSAATPAAGVEIMIPRGPTRQFIQRPDCLIFHLIYQSLFRLTVRTVYVFGVTIQITGVKSLDI